MAGTRVFSGVAAQGILMVAGGAAYLAGRFLLLVAFFLVLQHTSFAQSGDLARAAWLGAALQPLSADSGLLVTQVVGGTSKAIGLVAGDRLLSIDGKPLRSRADVSALLQGRKAGMPFTLTWNRAGKNRTAKFHWVGRPFEAATDSLSEVVYTSAAFGNGRLRVIINKPKAAGKHPAMFFIPGYTCSSIDNLTPDHPYKRIVDAYVKAGFVTLRIEKSGLGDSEGTLPCAELDLYQEIANFEVGLLQLKQLPYVDTSKVIIYGHSMGGIIAPALAARHKVAGVAVYGTTAKSWFEYQIEMYRVQNALAGLDPLALEKSVTDQYALNYRFFVEKQPLEELAKNPSFDSTLRSSWEYDGRGKIYSRNALYWRQIQDVNHLAHWRDAANAVLVQFGESDFQAFSLADHQQIVNTVNYYRPATAQLQTFPLTDHYFARSGSMQEAFNKFSQGQIQQLFQEYNPAVGEGAVRWSLSVVAPEAKSQGSWRKLPTAPYPGKQDDIWFHDERLGWYVNGSGKIYGTRDGGDRWELLFEQPGTFFRTILFVDSLLGFAGNVGTDYFPNVRDTVPLYRTRNGGRSWEPVQYRGSYVKGLCALSLVREPFNNHGQLGYRIHVYGVGRVGSPANWMESHDGGENWTARSLPESAKMAFDVQMMDTKTGFVCAASSEQLDVSHAVMLKTTDGGLNWKEVYRSPRGWETSWKMSFPTATTGYMTIQSYNPDSTVRQQRIAKTTNGGESWVELPLVEDHRSREFGIGFLDEQYGFVGTLTGGFETRDGGNSWQRVNLGRAANKIRFIQRADGKRIGYAIGVEVFRYE